MENQNTQIYSEIYLYSRYSQQLITRMRSVSLIKLINVIQFDLLNAYYFSPIIPLIFILETSRTSIIAHLQSHPAYI